MTEHNINIERKYFEPIHKGQITLLIFKTQEILELSENDTIKARSGVYEVEAKIESCYIKCFQKVTDEEARKAGFLNKEFLKEELIKRFDLKPIISFLDDNIDKELFFFIKLEQKNPFKNLSNMTMKNVDLYSKEYNKEFYNPKCNVSTKIWGKN